MFGVLLSQQDLGSDGIPHLVAKCLQFVETYGMVLIWKFTATIFHTTNSPSLLNEYDVKGKTGP